MCFNVKHFNVWKEWSQVYFQNVTKLFLISCFKFSFRLTALKFMLIVCTARCCLCVWKCNLKQTKHSHAKFCCWFICGVLVLCYVCLWIEWCWVFSGFIALHYFFFFFFLVIIYDLLVAASRSSCQPTVQYIFLRHHALVVNQQFNIYD